MRGDRPTEGQFDSLLDSTVNIADDRYLLGLRSYEPLKAYVIGDTMIYSNALYQCIANTTGTFNPAAWQVIASLGAVVYSGTWNASSNFPTLVDGVGSKGFYYVVSAGGVQDLGSGPIDFQISDWVIYNGTIWQKVDNSQMPVVAADVEFTPNGDITSTNVQDAIVEVRNDTDSKLAAKQNLITLTPNYFPYADSANTLADGALINEADGVVLDSGKVFRSIVPGKSQIDFPAANTVIISTDGGAGAEGVLLLDTDTASVRRTGYGELYISPGNDALGAITLLNNNGSNGITINNDLVRVVNNQGQGGSIDIASDGKIDVQSDVFRVNSPATVFNALTPSTVPYLDSSKNLLSSSVTPAELGYLSGTSSAIQTQLNGKLNLSGGTMTGNLVLNADPTAALQASTKQYVDAADSNLQSQLNGKLNLSGGTMTGNLLLNANPSAALGAATKQYVDSADSLLQSQINDKLSLSGGTLTGNLILNADPSATLGAATKQYVDTGLATKQNSLGFTPVPDSRTVNGHALTSNVTVTKADIGLASVTDDQQLSQKVYGADEHIVPPPPLPTASSTAFVTAYTNTFSLAAGSYIVDWYYEIGSSTAAGDTGARVSFGGTIVSESICKPGVAGAFSAMTGFYERGTPLAAGSYTFLLEINRPTAGGTVTLRRPRFKVTKI